jgi:hypothetical protein
VTPASLKRPSNKGSKGKGTRCKLSHSEKELFVDLVEEIQPAGSHGWQKIVNKLIDSRADGKLAPTEQGRKALWDQLSNANGNYKPTGSGGNRLCQRASDVRNEMLQSGSWHRKRLRSRRKPDSGPPGVGSRCTTCA